MNNKNTGQWAIAVGMVISSLILMYAASSASKRISGALVLAGQHARPAPINIPPFPRNLQVDLKDPTRLRIEMNELKVASIESREIQPDFKLEPEDRQRIADRFVAAVTGKTDQQGRQITNVDIASTTATPDGKSLTVKGKLHFQKPSPSSTIAPLPFYCIMKLDGFGDFTGDVRQYRNTSRTVLLSDVHITITNADQQ